MKPKDERVRDSAADAVGIASLLNEGRKNDAIVLFAYCKDDETFAEASVLCIQRLLKALSTSSELSPRQIGDLVVSSIEGS